MTGLVGIACGEHARFSAFYFDLCGMDRPEGTQVAWRTGPYVSINRNELVKEALKIDADWIWFLDDDHRFDSDILMRLLSHGADITVPLCLKKQMPFTPVIYEGRMNDRWLSIGMNEIPTTGTFRVGCAGTGGMLIRRHVLEALDEPWFEMETAPDGEILGEDFTFSDKAVRAGFEIVCDTEARLGHIGTVTIWPSPSEDGQEVRMQLDADGHSITFTPRVAAKV